MGSLISWCRSPATVPGAADLIRSSLQMNLRLGAGWASVQGNLRKPAAAAGGMGPQSGAQPGAQSGEQSGAQSGAQSGEQS